MQSNVVCKTIAYLKEVAINEDLGSVSRIVTNTALQSTDHSPCHKPIINTKLPCDHEPSCQSKNQSKSWATCQHTNCSVSGINILLKNVKMTVTATIAVCRLLSIGPSVAVDAMIHEVQGVTWKERYFEPQQDPQDRVLATEPSIYIKIRSPRETL